MSLYVRLQTSFWTNRKTMRLRAIIGDDAFWVPPRLWCYAANNQSDGSFADYAPDELAQLIGYSRDGAHMIEALQQAGFMDADRRLHDWASHNGYHATFKERAKTAAKARWKKPKSETNSMKGKERRQALLQACLKHATSMGFDSAAFTEEWQRWIELRTAAKKPADGNWERFFEGQLKWLLKFPQSDATEIVSTSIRNNWTGLFDLKPQAAAPKKRNEAAL